MSLTPIEHAGSLRIGTVDYVSPDEVKVLLEIDAPESVALNAGTPRPFPRVNSYVLIPVDDGFLVGQISWITVERSPFPKRRGMQDFGLVDLPYPLRKMSLSPLGTLRKSERGKYSFRRGADALPSIGSSVLLPTGEQLRSIVESGDRRRVKIGTSPLAGDAEVCVDPNRLFGRHLAVLGNTGSGKSCSVAGLIRWSIEQAQAQRSGTPNARFIVLDPNGEYSRAFSDDALSTKARVFKVNAGRAQLPLQVPLWFWNSAEWAAFTQASTKTQRPTLVHALRTVRDGDVEPVSDSSHDLRRFLRTIVTTLRIERNTGAPFMGFPKAKGFCEKLEKWKESLETDLDSLLDDPKAKIQAFINRTEDLCAPRRPKYAQLNFTKQEVDELIDLASIAHSALGGNDSDLVPFDVDAPRPFSGDSLLRAVEAAAEMLNVAEHVETLLVRIRSLLTDTRMKPILGAGQVTLDRWLSDNIGSNDAEAGCITIIDLSLVPSEVVHVVTAVIARMVFEALQRYVKLETVSLPTVMVMEEAHTFIKRYKEDIENHDAASICCQVFERIAREGRKFGLGLILSSQRPSELSPTVLSQCNSFLLHRISNDRDQEMLHRLVPDNLKGLLRELPSLPSQNAILLGWASELPVLVRMKDLPKLHQPRSEDPDFWGVWVGKDEAGEPLERAIDWADVARDWQSLPSRTPGENDE